MRSAVRTLNPRSTAMFPNRLQFWPNEFGQAESLDSVREATRTALQVGNTSGTDGVLGLLLGCIAWAAPSYNFFQPTSALARTLLPSRHHQVDIKRDWQPNVMIGEAPIAEFHSILMNEGEAGADVTGRR